MPRFCVFAVACDKVALRSVTFGDGRFHPIGHKLGTALWGEPPSLRQFSIGTRSVGQSLSRVMPDTSDCRMGEDNPPHGIEPHLLLDRIGDSSLPSRKGDENNDVPRANNPLARSEPIAGKRPIVNISYPRSHCQRIRHNEIGSKFQTYVVPVCNRQRNHLFAV